MARRRTGGTGGRPLHVAVCALIAVAAAGGACAAPRRSPTTATGPGGPEHRLGLRVARRLDARTVRLTFGGSVVPRAATDAKTYRIVSMTDPAYRKGLRAASTRHSSEPDVTPPAGWSGKRHERHTVVITLPRPMRKGHRYHVQALGGGRHNQPITGGRAAMWIEEMVDGDEKKLAAENALGVRRMELVSPDTVQITVGDGFDPARFDGHPETIVLTCPEDPDFRNGRRAARVGRRSRGDCYHTDGWPYGYFLRHELFATFDRPLKQGTTYSLDLNAAAPLTSARANAELTVHDRTTVNPCVKVNQIGYLPDAPAKFAYLGAWMGSAGALDYSRYELRFEVRDAETHEAVLAGAAKLRHRSGERNETVYKHDLSFEDVYEMDISALFEEGSYYLAVSGMGRSFEFRVAKDVYVEPFRVMMEGVFHQRCGIEIGPPHSRHYRPACHRNMTELTDLVHGGESNAWKNLPKRVIDERKYDLFGGHHDAGDYNPRSHLDVAEAAFMAYEMKPGAYSDGQLSMPEAANSIPDILDEGRWALDLWCRLQDSDGGVRNGTESDGDPNMITLGEFDSKRDFAFAKDPKGSLRFAGAAAQAAKIWGGLGKGSDASKFLKRARAAWNWAMRRDGEKHHDSVVRAAIQLYRVTGEKKYREAFEKHSVFNRMENAKLEEWKKYDQRDASFYYAFCRRPVEPALKQKILGTYKQMLGFWIRWAETTAYRYMRNPYAPNNWGTGCHPKWVGLAIQGYVLTKDPAYLKWTILTSDFALGCHPMNTVFTTRLGQRCISGPLHMFSRYSPEGPIAGIQCEGPSPQVGGKKAGRSMGSWIAAMLYPYGDWPQLHTYTDVVMSPSMNEPMVADQIKTAAVYGFLLPER